MLLSEGKDFGLITALLEKAGVDAHTAHSLSIYIYSLLAVAILAVLGFKVFKKVRKPENYLIPEKKTSVTNIFDATVGWLLDLMEEVLGQGNAARHLPLIGSLFLFILFANMLGLIPGLAPSTSDLNTNLAMALIVFLYYNYFGIKHHGFVNYMKHFMGPMIWIAPLFFVIEIVSHVVRPLSLSIRLFGNMTADHAVLAVFTDMTKLGVPVIFLGLGLFVCLVQAFVFALLSIVYIALAEAHMDEAH